METQMPQRQFLTRKYIYATSWEQDIEHSSRLGYMRRWQAEIIATRRRAQEYIARGKEKHITINIVEVRGILHWASDSEFGYLPVAKVTASTVESKFGPRLYIFILAFSSRLKALEADAMVNLRSRVVQTDVKYNLLLVLLK